MKAKVGDILISNLDGQAFIVDQIINKMAVLKSKDGKREILAGIEGLDSLYRREVPGINKDNERRRDSRHLVKDDVIASVHNKHMIVGKVKDMSIEGLAFEHLEPKDERKAEQESLEWNLYLLMHDFMLSRVPCRIVYNISVPSSTDSGIPPRFQTKRCGVQFHSLSDNQKILIKSFLEKYIRDHSCLKQNCHRRSPR